MFAEVFAGVVWHENMGGGKCSYFMFGTKDAVLSLIRHQRALTRTPWTPDTFDFELIFVYLELLSCFQIFLNDPVWCYDQQFTKLCYRWQSEGAQEGTPAFRS